MSLSDSIKTDRLFKESQDRRMTSTGKAYYEENAANLRVILGEEVWLDTIDSTPATAVSQGIAFKCSGWLIEDTSVANDQAWFASGNKYAGGYWKRWIPPKCGQGYTIKIYKSGSGGSGPGTELGTTDVSDWVFDYQEGTLWFQDAPGYSSPYYISGYRYSGVLSKKSSFNALYPGSSSLISKYNASGKIAGLTISKLNTPGSAKVLKWDVSNNFWSAQTDLTGGGGGTSSWVYLNASTGITPWVDNTRAISGQGSAVSLSVAGYTTISSNARQGYYHSSNAKNLYADSSNIRTRFVGSSQAIIRYAPSRSVRNGLQTITGGSGAITHGLIAAPNYWNVRPSGNVNFGINSKVDATKIYVNLTTISSRPVYWYAST